MKQIHSSKIPWLGKIVPIGITFSFLLLFSAGTFAQSIKGKVTDETGTGMPGVNILVQGTSEGTISDIDGSFEIRAAKGATLLFSFTGYASQSIVVNDNASLNVTMQPSSEILGEVVVTGYSTQRKRDITGAVSVVDADELNKVTATSFTQKLEGRASGLSISSSGEPGEGTTVRIRGISGFGNNDPLYIIDGVPVQDAFNTGFNPNDIETIQVLKDASAASIYGARANNGVIIVTTKRGKSGKVRVTYDANLGVANPINTPDYMITDPKDYSDYIWTKYENAGLTVDESNPYAGGRGVLPTYSYPYGPGITPSDADYSYPNSLVMRANQQGTNWFDEVFDPALITEHNLGISGGNDLGSYYISGSYTDQNGTMLNNYFKRYSLRANTEFKKGRFTFGENMSLSRVNSVGNDGVSGGNQDEQGVMTWITLMNPLTPIYDVGGNFAGDKANLMSNGSNPVAALIRNKDNEGTYYRVLGNAYTELNLTKNLKARTSFGMDFYNNYKGEFTFPTFENKEPSNVNGFREDWGNGFTWTWTNTLSYSATLADAHALQVLVGYEAIENKNRYINGSLNDYFTLNINAWYLNGGLANPGSRQVNSGGGRSALASVFGKVDYSFMDKYLISATVRRDGSSNFGDDTKYGVFPAVSLGWRVSKESFLESATWLEDLKLRFGWGITGNQRIPGGNVFDQYGGGTASTFYDITGSNSGLTTGYTLTKRGNENTKWEENVSTNFGLDASLFDGKLGFVVDVYNRKVDGLLYAAPLPGTAGTAGPAYVNIASMQNKGVDLGLDYKNKINNDFGYSVGITFSQYANEVVSIDGGSETFFPTGFDSRVGPINFNKVGLPISTFYGLTADGLFRSQAEVDAHADQPGKAVGRIRFKDLNGDGVINDDDKGAIGDAHPDFYGGINLGVNYKNFDLSVFMFASVGNQLFNYNKLFSEFGFFNSNVRKDRVTDAFDAATNPDGKFPILDVNDTYSYVPSSYYVEDASYLRCKNIQLGYTFPSASLGKVFSSLRVYVQAQNLFTITGYSGLDPAPSNFGIQDSNPNDLSAALISDLWTGFDFGNYPANKIFMIGVNAGF